MYTNIIKNVKISEIVKSHITFSQLKILTHQSMYIQNVQINIVTILRHWLIKSLLWENSHKRRLIEISLRIFIWKMFHKKWL